MLCITVSGLSMVIQTFKKHDKITKYKLKFDIYELKYS
jgi:hypothetical protein